MKHQNKRALPVYFFILSALLFISGELLLNYYGKSFCETKSCEIVSNLLIIPKTYLLFLAFAYFFSLFLLTKIYLYTEGPLFLNLLLLTIITGFTGDALFLAKLIFEYKLVCYFCLAISFLLFLTVLSYLYLFKGFKFNTVSLFFILLGVLLGNFLALKIATPELVSLTSSKKPFTLVYDKDCPRCKEILSKIDPKGVDSVPLYRLYPLFKIFDLKSVPVLIEKQGSSWIIYSTPEEISAKLLKNNSSLENIPCDNETQGGLCVLP